MRLWVDQSKLLLSPSLHPMQTFLISMRSSRIAPYNHLIKMNRVKAYPKILLDFSMNPNEGILSTHLVLIFAK